MPVTALIKFVQGLSTPPAGQALVGVLTTPVTVSNGDNSGPVVNWKFTVIDSPPGSTVPVGVAADGAASSYTFAPDVRGGYHIELVTRDAAGNQAVDRRVFQIAEVSGRIIPPFSANAAALNFGGETRGWSPIMEDWLHFVDSGGGSGGAVIFDDSVPATDSNIRSDRVLQSPIDNTKAGITNISSRSVGATTGATGAYSTIIGGDQNQVSANYGVIAGGLTNVISNIGGFIGAGEQNTVNGDYGCCLAGQFNTSGTYATTCGDSCTASAYASFATGIGTTASGSGAAAFGDSCTATDIATMAIGSACHATAQYAFAGGLSSTASGLGSFAFGQTATATASGATAIGAAANATGIESLALGKSCKTVRQGQFSHACGKFSVVGDCQAGQIIVHGTSTNGVAAVLKTDAPADLALENGVAYHLRATCVANRTDAAGRASFVHDLLVHASAGSAVIDNDNTTLSIPNGQTWTIVFSTSGLGIVATFTGTAGHTVRAAVTYEWTEVGGGV